MTGQFALPGFDEPPAPRRRAKAPHEPNPGHGLFFGVVPQPADRGRIEAVARVLCDRHGARGRPVGAERLHVTCCDLGSTREAPEPGLIEAAMAVAAGLVLPPVEIVFERVMRFKGKDVLVLLEREGAAALKPLCDALDAALVQAGVPVDKGGLAHMTLAYRCNEVSEALAEPVRWLVQDFALIHSLVGQGEHRHLGRWPLSARR